MKIIQIFNKEKEMTNENMEYKDHANPLNVVVGAVTMLLLAPRSGKDTRKQIQEKGIELRDRTNEIVEGTLTQIRSSVDRLTLEGREKFNELKHHGQELAVEQLDHVAEAAKAGKKALQNS